MDEMDFQDYQRGMKQINADIPLDLWTNAKKNLIGLSEAARFGIQFKLADMDNGMTFEYPPTNLQKKLIQKCRALEEALQEANNKIENLQKNVEDLE